MDIFTYKLRLEELSRLKTKKAKTEFIHTIISTYPITSYDILLAEKVREVLLPQKITGAAALRAFINYAVQRIDDIENLSKLKPTDVTAGNDYHTFMYSSGIPAYLKLAVLNARKQSGI